MQDLFIEFLPPWVETGLQPAFYDRESGTVLQQTARMYAKVNELVKAVNGMDKIIKEYVDYIDNYFKNLDVQEEINNKLDDMAESGELETAIAQFLAVAPVFAYTTVADMVASEYLDTGCIARTLGKESVDDGLGSYYVIGETGDIELDNGKFATKVGKSLNTTLAFNTLNDLIEAENIETGYTAIVLGKEALNDGYGAVYTIGDVGDVALDNGLYATLQNDFGNNYYDEITVTSNRQNDTDYYIATIPLNDNDGNIISPYVHDETDNPVHSPLEYADSEFTTLTINAGLGHQDSHDVWQQGNVIANGVITHYDQSDLPPQEICSYIGFTEDRTVLDFNYTVTPEYMLSQGVKNAFLTFGKIVNNGVISEDIDLTYIAPWTLIGVKADKTIIILSSDGRTEYNKGMTQNQVAGLMITLGCVNVWRCDGGGSNSLVYKGSKQNRNIDQNGTKDRNIWVTLNFKKETLNKEIAKVYSYIGKERQLLNKQIRDDVVAEYEKKKADLYFYNINTGYNVTTQGTEIKLVNRYCLTSDNAPYDDADGRVYSLIIDENNRYEGFKINKVGLFKVTITANIYCKNTAGERAIRIDSPFGTQAQTLSEMKNYIVPTADNQFHEMNGSFIINNATAGKEYFIGGWGQTNDDFNRLSIIVEELGPAD